MPSNLCRILLTGFVGSLLLTGAGAFAEQESVTLYTGARFVTMERGNPSAQAVAVAGQRIVGVGTLESVKASLGDMPYRIDETFKGKVAMPGLIEQHMHPFLGAMTLITEVIANDDWVLPGKTFKAALTPDAYRQRLVAAEKALGDSKEWLYSWGYHRLWHGELSRAELDKISTTRPIIVWQRSCHEFILNTAAVEALGLDRAKMAGKGLASTQFNWDRAHWWENGATELLFPALLPHMVTPQRMQAGLRMLIAYYHQKGVTALNEPGILLVPGLWDLYRKVLGAPDVPFMSTFFPDARSQMNAGLEGAEALAETERKVAWGTDGKVRMLPRQIKLLADGAIVSQFMMMKDGYTDGHHGEWLMPPDALEKYGKLYWDAGYQLHIHVTGDLGLDVTLDMLERRMRENPRADHRTVIVHFSNSTEAQVERIARLGAIVSSNPYYPIAFGNMYARFGLGPARAHVMSRQGSVIRHGIPLSFHSDLPVSPTDPLFQAWMGVTRQTNEGNVLAPDQRIGVHDALRAVTIEAAYSWRMEHELGSIAPGKLANFTVLEKDPYKVKPAKLKDIPIWGTVFEGRVFQLSAAVRSTSKQARLAPRFDPALSAHGHGGGDACDVNRSILLALAEHVRANGAVSPPL